MYSYLSFNTHVMTDSLPEDLRYINDSVDSTKETILVHWIAINFLPLASNNDEVVSLCGIV